MTHTKLDLSTVVKACVRLEGDSNQDWTLTTLDGTKHEYYAIEGSPQYVGTDERVYEFDTELSDFLDKLIIDLTGLVPGYDMSEDAIQFHIDLKTNKVYNIMVQLASEDWKERDIVGQVIQLRKF